MIPGVYARVIASSILRRSRAQRDLPTRTANDRARSSGGDFPGSLIRRSSRDHVVTRSLIIGVDAIALL